MADRPDAGRRALVPGAMEERERVLQQVRELLESGQDERLSNVIAELHPADLASVVRELPADDQIRVFRLLSIFPATFDAPAVIDSRDRRL